ncbi:MAG: acetate/propionate family kinase [Terrimonas ferruginea]|uniref:acetate/propionate family kinase n=1 Tax=Terrimonas ferruginea TaxID=249 RepID=UPI0009297E8C|nr:acetate/propionate family kinase [Terrimonas ferruginea]MBN8784062.1 acetate/propionate family kinase [Terrimonas ferruginea]OJW41637.1 MAG: acetate kinase [Sphingobacteriales bacterium 48-107]
MENRQNLLVINGGSSSIKFAMYQADNISVPILSGGLENIGKDNSRFSFINSINNVKETIPVEIENHASAAGYLLAWLEKQDGFSTIKVVGHRIVHGMQHTNATTISPELLNELKQICPYDPEHLPAEIKLVEIFISRHPSIMQVACFDTAFHTTMPHTAQLLPIPRMYFERGIKRYGFHGLSYTYLIEALQTMPGHDIPNEKIILAHLGSGTSLAAVKHRECIDTSMGFTPTSGLLMGSRTGDLDPGVAWYLMQVEKMTPEQFNQLINHKSGLLGISGSSDDMKELIKRKPSDAHAAEAFELFCYQTKKFIGSYAAALEGLDTLVFSGGIGEHSPDVRSQVCDGLDFLGIQLDEIKNMNNAVTISTAASKVTVHVIKTDEQIMIARLAAEVWMNEREKSNKSGEIININSARQHE